MNAFIINLSNIFDFDISMPVLSGLVAEKKVWMVKENGAFPINPSEALVSNKLFEFSNRYEHMRTTLGIAKTENTTELFLILGYEEWDFLPYGKLNAYSYFKIQYILGKLSELFKKPVKSLPFKVRIFMTAQAQSERHDFFDKLEEKGYIEGETPKWFSNEWLDGELSIDIESKKSFFVGKNADALIDNDTRTEIDYYSNKFSAKLDEFADKLQIPSQTVDGWKKLFRDRLNEVKTIKQFSDIITSATPVLKQFLFNTFSLVANVSELSPVYKYTIDTSSTAKGLRNKFEYTLFILQFVIDPLIEEQRRLYKVNDIEINVPALTPMLGKLQSTIDRYKKKTIDLEKEEDYNTYTVNDSYYRNLPIVNNTDRNNFYTLTSVRNILGWFYSRRKKEIIQDEFERNAYSLLENKIPIETGCFSSLLKDALNKQTKSIAVKMIPTEIIRFEQSRLVSPIDFQHYVIERDKLLQEQKEKIEELVKMLPTLPFMSNVMYAVGAVLLCMALFTIPVFSWQYWDNMLFFLPIFFGVVCGVAIFALSSIRKKIHNKIFELEAIRAALANNLSQHCTNIKTAATQMAEAFAKRETLKELKELQQKYDNQSYRYLAYDSYHNVNEESIKRLCKIYGIDTLGSDTSTLSPSYDKHPEDDPNLVNEFPINDIDIVINQQQTPKSNIRTIVRKIEIRSI